MSGWFWFSFLPVVLISMFLLGNTWTGWNLSFCKRIFNFTETTDSKYCSLPAVIQRSMLQKCGFVPVPLFSVAIYSSVSLLFTFVKNVFILIIIFVLCVLVLFPHVQQCITCCTAHRDPKGIRAPGTRVIDICELLGIESMSSGEHLVFLTTDLFLCYFFIFLTYCNQRR